MEARKFCWLCLLIIFSIASCSKGGGEKITATLTGAAGQFCISTDNQYTITDSKTGQSQTIPIEPEQFFAHFKGNISGQIRAVTSFVISGENQEPATMLIWGSGSSVQYGAAGAMLGPLLLKNKGAVVDLASYTSGANLRVFYGGERGFGIIELKGDGKLGELAFRTIPTGVLSVAALSENDKTRFVFVTGDGYVLTTTEDALTSGNGCYDILTSPSALTEGEAAYIPVKIAVANAKVLVLAKKSTAGGLTPTFKEAFDPILESLITNEAPSIIRAVDLTSLALEPVAFSAESGGYIGFDQFIPTDVASDKTNFYAAGLAYEKSAVDSLIIGLCDRPSTAEKIGCLRDLAKTGDLTSLKNSIGVDAFTGGFFIYRDLTKMGEKAAHFARVPVTTFANIETAPPLVFSAAVNDDKAAFRAPNFLAVLTKSASSTGGEERWVIGPEFDSHKGINGSIPAALTVYNLAGSSFIAATSVGVKGDDGSGASILEGISPDGKFLIGDTGAIMIRMEDGAEAYLAAIDLASARGGTLYLENAVERKRIDADTRAGVYVSRAAYNGTDLAFAWSAPGEAWRIEWQKGTDSATRGQLSFARAGDSHHYKNFPDVSAGDLNAFEDAHDIADMSFADGKLFILYYGFAAAKHYYQAAVYESVFSDGRHHPALRGVTTTLSFAGDEIDRRARFQKIAKNNDGSFTALFSCAGGLRQFQITPSSSVASAAISNVFSAPNVIDLDFDDAGQRFAYISQKTIHIRNLASPTTDITTTSLPASDTTTARLSNASLVLISNRLLIATPQGASAPFWVMDATQAKPLKVISKCGGCQFNALAGFASFPNQLLASSETGGVEIYDISGL